MPEITNFLDYMGHYSTFTARVPQRQGLGFRMNCPASFLSQLESYLWEAVNILRGPVDAANVKTCIFPLLFFKRICVSLEIDVETLVSFAHKITDSSNLYSGVVDRD